MACFDVFKDIGVYRNGWCKCICELILRRVKALLIQVRLFVPNSTAVRLLKGILALMV